MNSGKLIIFGLVLFLLTATRPIAAAVLVCESPKDKHGFSHKISILLPKEYSGSVGYRDAYGEFSKELGNQLSDQNIGLGVLDWSYSHEDGNKPIDDRYDFFLFKQNSFYQVGFAASSGSNMVIIRIENIRKEIKFRFHSTYSLHDTVTGTCK